MTTKMLLGEKMNNYIDNQNTEVSENVLAGIVGAFLFSLVGAAVYFILNLFGYIASISGLIGAVCAVKGYAVFAKKESKKGIIIAAIISILVMVLAWYLSFSYDIYSAYKEWFASGEVDFTLTFVESVKAVPLFLEESEVATTAYGNLAISLLFCIGGCASYVITKVKNANKKKVEAPAEQTAELNGQPTENSNDSSSLE